MKVIKAKDYESMSKMAAMMVCSEVVEGVFKRKNIAITAGSTPRLMYEYLEKLLKDIPISNTHYYNFDEIPMKNAEGVTIKELKKLYFNPCGIPDENIHIFNEENYENYDSVIAKDGGIDFLIMGLGMDGHFCGNLSGTLKSFDEGCHSVSNTLNKKLEERIAFLCQGKENMTDYYVTFGPKTVMNCKKLVMIVSGKDKADILHKVLLDPININVPSSIFQLHPDFTVIADEEALSSFTEEELQAIL